MDGRIRQSDKAPKGRFRSLSDLSEDEYLEWLIPLLQILQGNYDRTGRRSYRGVGDDDLRKLLEADVISADQHETEMLRREERMAAGELTVSQSPI